MNECHVMTLDCLDNHKCNTCKHMENSATIRCYECTIAWRNFEGNGDEYCGWEPKDTENTKMFPPGSKIAIEHGCTCPVIDNHYGKGIPYTRDDGCVGYTYWYTYGCPIHYPLREEEIK